MDINTLKSLGLDVKVIQESIIEQAVEQLLRENTLDQYGDETSEPSALSVIVQKYAKKRIDEKIAEIASEHIIPKIDSMIEGLVLQETTKWGEKVGQPMTFVEYLVARAQAYMVEDVDHNGKSKAENDSYSWSKHSTRITHAIHKYLQYEIHTAMQSALSQANSTMAKGLHEACRTAINDVAAKFKISVTS